MKVSKFALAVMMGLGATGVVLSPAADAQRGSGGEQQQAQQREFDLSRAERAALAPLYEAIEKNDWAAAQAALPAAKAAAQGADAKYIVAQLQFEIAQQTQNEQMQSEAVDAMLASGSASPQNLRPLLSNQIAFAIRANDMEKAERALTRFLEISPNDVGRLTQLAEVKIRRNDRPEALRLYQRALQLSQAAGQKPEENVYKRALALAYDARQPQPSVELSRALVAAYPNPVNWRDALLILRDISRPEGEVDLDLLRLMRTAGALSGERDYLELAQTLNQRGLPGEAKAVIDEGVARGMLDASEPAVRDALRAATARVAEDRASLAGLQTRAAAAANGTQARAVADALLGYGQYREAAEMYRLALHKGGVDADLVNTRLGIALAQAGDRAGAEAAFQAVGGPRDALADFWLAWLAQRAA